MIEKYKNNVHAIYLKESSEEEREIFYNDYVIVRRENQTYETVSVGFWSRTYKSTGIGECTGVLRNYSISKMKLCRNLTSAQAKTRFLSSLNSSLEFKWKML